MHDGWKLLVLVLCVPLQLWLSQATSPKDLTNARGFSGGFGFAGWVSDGWWKDGAKLIGDKVQLFAKIHKRVSEEMEPKARSNRKGWKQTQKQTYHRQADELDIGVSEAVEVKKLEYFSGSRAPRKDRSRVKYRVGQVFVHKVHGYKGLIVGWDEVPKAPEAWFKRMGVSEADQKKPMYSVLVDSRDRDDDGSRTYVNEKNIVLCKSPDDSFDFKHKDLGSYVESFSRKMNLFYPRPPVRKRYPKD